MNKKYLLIVLMCCSFLFSCQTIPERGPVEKDGKVYGVTEGAFRHKWWNYYERALSYADGGFFQEAELDLQEALKLRDKDQRRARTYGMHFIDYFPHRELGIALYGQKRLDEALRELDTSLASVKSAEAELYWDRVRKRSSKKENLINSRLKLSSIRRSRLISRMVLPAKSKDWPEMTPTFPG